VPLVDGARIHSIQISDGGVPKRAVAEAEITAAGLRGDRQRDLRIHGGPMRAVCLYSLEAIERLRAEGHPIAPGTTGENLTIAGLDWGKLVSGARLRIGGGVVLELTKPAQPCRNIAGSFRDGDSSRISTKRFPNDGRWYARVVCEGVVGEGDAVALD
jgi:MOSC domain-containing protein YiiM